MTQQTTNETTEREAAFEEWFGTLLENPTNDYLAIAYWAQEAWNAAWLRRAALPPTSGEAVNMSDLIAKHQVPKAAHMAELCAKSAAPAAPVADTGAVAWAVTAQKGGIHKLSITRESAERKAERWREEWPDNGCRVRPLIFGDAAPASPAPTADSAEDARRYQFVRQADWDDLKSIFWSHAVQNAGTPEQCMQALDAAIDAAIDAAMSTNTGEGK